MTLFQSHTLFKRQKLLWSWSPILPVADPEPCLVAGVARVGPEGEALDPGHRQRHLDQSEVSVAVRRPITAHLDPLAGAAQRRLLAHEGEVVGAHEAVVELAGGGVLSAHTEGLHSDD